jgi:hypothetical protein
VQKNETLIEKTHLFWSYYPILLTIQSVNSSLVVSICIVRTIRSFVVCVLAGKRDKLLYSTVLYSSVLNTYPWIAGTPFFRSDRHRLYDQVLHVHSNCTLRRTGCKMRLLLKFLVVRRRRF